MSRTINIIRDWLERNKIFFEIVATIFLTLMSITVSYNANQIATYQNELIKEESQPIFVFSLTHADNGSLDIGERIDIYNIGKPAYNFDAETNVFFDIHLFNYSDFSKKNAFIPVINFYVYSIKTGSPTNLLMSFNKHYFFPINGTNYTGNYAVFYHIDQEFYNYSHKQNCFGYIEIKRYVHITYFDVYGESHDEIYYVDEGTSYKLTEKDKIKLVKKYNDGDIPNYGFLDFRYLSPEEIIRILSIPSVTIE